MGDILSLGVFTRDYFGGASTAVISIYFFSHQGVLQSGNRSNWRSCSRNKLVPVLIPLSFDLIAPDGTVSSSCEFDIIVSAFVPANNTFGL